MNIMMLFDKIAFLRTEQFFNHDQNIFVQHNAKQDHRV